MVSRLVSSDRPLASILPFYRQYDIVIIIRDKIPKYYFTTE